MRTSKYSSLNVVEYPTAKISMEMVTKLSPSRSSGGIDMY